MTNNATSASAGKMNTYNTIQSLLFSFEDNYHLPSLALVNNAQLKGTHPALLEAIKQTEQAITALGHLQTVVTRLVERDSSTITQEEAWRVSDDLAELLHSLLYLIAELGQLSIEIAEEYMVCGE